MERNLNIKVGQKVIVEIEENSNASRYVDMSLENIDNWCFEGEVIKAGRKYITVKFNQWAEEQFAIDDDYRQKYTAGGSDYKLYLNKEEIIEEKEANTIYMYIKNEFSGYGNSKYSLEQLRAIKDIIDKNKEEE